MYTCNNYLSTKLQTEVVINVEVIMNKLYKNKMNVIEKGN